MFFFFLRINDSFQKQNYLNNRQNLKIYTFHHFLPHFIVCFLILWAVVQVPNGFGCGLGTLQLILYAIYRNSGKPKKPAAAAAAAADVELGKPQLEKPSKSPNENP